VHSIWYGTPNICCFIVATVSSIGWAISAVILVSPNDGIPNCASILVVDCFSVAYVDLITALSWWCMAIGQIT